MVLVYDYASRIDLTKPNLLRRVLEIFSFSEEILYIFPYVCI